MPGPVPTAPSALAQKVTRGPPPPLTTTRTNSLSNAPAKATVTVSLANASALMVSGEKGAAAVHAPMSAAGTVFAKVLKSLLVITNRTIPHKTLLPSTTLRGTPNTNTGANATMGSVAQTAAKLNAHQPGTPWVEKVPKWAAIARAVEPAITALVFANATLDIMAPCAKLKPFSANF
jgi:hypothetical protein